MGYFFYTLAVLCFLAFGAILLSWLSLSKTLLPVEELTWVFRGGAALSGGFTFLFFGYVCETLTEIRDALEDQDAEREDDSVSEVDGYLDGEI